MDDFTADGQGYLLHLGRLSYFLATAGSWGFRVTLLDAILIGFNLRDNFSFRRLSIEALQHLLKLSLINGKFRVGENIILSVLTLRSLVVSLF